MEKITGKNNDLIKGIKKLTASSKARREENSFVLEGARLTFDVLNSFCDVKLFLVTQCAYDKYTELCDKMISLSQKSYLISQEVAQRLGETENTQGVFAVCSLKQDGFEIKPGGKYIALDNVQDPGNLGAVIRTAEALGIDGVVLGGGCDPYNPKVLRASMGSVLRINTLQTKKLADCIGRFKEKGLNVYATVPDETAKSISDIDFSKGAVCIIGNEANGVSEEIASMADDSITIKMSGNAESLNASVAAAITMWEMLR